MLRKTRSYKFWKEETATQVGQRLLVSSSDALVLTDIETFDLWELEHRRALIVEILILVANAFEYLPRSGDQSPCRSEAPFKNIW